MASLFANWLVAAPPFVPVEAVAFHRLLFAQAEHAAGLRLADRTLRPAPAQMTPGWK